MGDWFAVSVTPLRQLCSMTTASVPGTWVTGLL